MADIVVAKGARCVDCEHERQWRWDGEKWLEENYNAR